MRNGAGVVETDAQIVLMRREVTENAIRVENASLIPVHMLFSTTLISSYIKERC